MPETQNENVTFVAPTTQKDAAAALDVSTSILRTWQNQPGFPDFANGYDIEAIKHWRDAQLQPPVSSLQPPTSRRKASAAGECPKNANHPHTVVYRTAGRTRYCKCNDCGSTWKKLGGYSDVDREFLHTLAGELDGIERHNDSDDQQVVVLSDGEAREMSQRLREIAE